MNKKFFYFFIGVVFLLNLTTLSAATTVEKFFYAKKNYITAVLHNNRAKEIKYLKSLIIYGTKLNKNVYKYKKELSRLGGKITIPKESKKISSKSKYDISDVTAQDNFIQIDFNHNISKKYVKFYKSKKRVGYIYTFDIKGRFQYAKPTKLQLDSVDKIKIVQYRYNTLRITITNKSDLKVFYVVNRDNILIKTQPTVKNIKIQRVYKKQKVNLLGKTIVIDAGHGGKDSGAVGPRRRYEKVVVLSIAKRLYYNLKQKGFNVYLTRNKDKFVSLKYRTKFANKRKADLFISIHANATVKRRRAKAKGIETYFLSPARSARAKRVAALENKADMNSMGYSSKNILLTLLNRNKIISSQKVAIDVQSHILYNLRKYYGNKIVDAGVREGPFWVLVGASMPSVLVEVGYITHPEESKRIYTHKYQQRVADGIANGIVAYFQKNSI